MAMEDVRWLDCGAVREVLVFSPNPAPKESSAPLALPLQPHTQRLLSVTPSDFRKTVRLPFRLIHKNNERQKGVYIR